MKKVQFKIKFVKYITFLRFKWFLQKMISSLLNDHFNNNIASLESKIIYFFLRPNFLGRTILNQFSPRFFHNNAFFQLKLQDMFEVKKYIIVEKFWGN